MKIGLVSKEFYNGDINRNVYTILKSMEENKDLDLILFPESFIQGFHGIVFDYQIDKDRALTIDSYIIKKLQKYCRRLSLALGFGYIERGECKLYSSYMVVDKYGEIIHNFRRISPGWKEKFADYHYVEGDKFETFTLEGKTFITAICGDLWFDENIIKLHSMKCDYVIWPNYNSYTKEKWENNEKIEYANRAKIIGDNVFWFNSHNNGDCSKSYGGAIYFKEGKIHKELPMGEKGVLVFEI